MWMGRGENRNTRFKQFSNAIVEGWRHGGEKK
jgi:hypothetical protein